MGAEQVFIRVAMVGAEQVVRFAKVGAEQVVRVAKMGAEQNAMNHIINK